jgi:hypothetical protein
MQNTAFFQNDELSEKVSDTSTGANIAELAMSHNTNHRALAELLAILRVYHPELPADPKTLLDT